MEGMEVWCEMLYLDGHIGLHSEYHCYNLGYADIWYKWRYRHSPYGTMPRDQKQRTLDTHCNQHTQYNTTWSKQLLHAVLVFTNEEGD